MRDELGRTRELHLDLANRVQIRGGVLGDRTLVLFEALPREARNQRAVPVHGGRGAGALEIADESNEREVGLPAVPAVMRVDDPRGTFADGNGLRQPNSA